MCVVLATSFLPLVWAKERRHNWGKKVEQIVYFVRLFFSHRLNINTLTEEENIFILWPV